MVVVVGAASALASARAQESGGLTDLGMHVAASMVVAGESEARELDDPQPAQRRATSTPPIGQILTDNTIGPHLTPHADRLRGTGVNVDGVAVIQRVTASADSDPVPFVKIGCMILASLDIVRLLLAVPEPPPVDRAVGAVCRRSLLAGLTLDHAEALAGDDREGFGVVVDVIHGARVGRGNGVPLLAVCTFVQQVPDDELKPFKRITPVDPVHRPE
jgi:hypothetical protein